VVSPNSGVQAIGTTRLRFVMLQGWAALGAMDQAQWLLVK